MYLKFTVTCEVGKKASAKRQTTTVADWNSYSVVFPRDPELHIRRTFALCCPHTSPAEWAWGISLGRRDPLQLLNPAAGINNQGSRPVFCNCVGRVSIGSEREHSPGLSNEGNTASPPAHLHSPQPSPIPGPIDHVNLAINELCAAHTKKHSQGVCMRHEHNRNTPCTLNSSI